MRFAATLLLVFATLASAAKHKKAKSHKVHHRAKVHAATRLPVNPNVPVVATGNAELDRLLAERPKPESWTDSVLTTPAQTVARATREETPRGQIWSGATPVERLHSVADPLLGVRYRTGGNGERGFDCSGFVQKVVNTFGVTLIGRSSGSYWTQGEPIAEENLQTGDLVFFSNDNRRIGHVGIYLENGKFIHASVAEGIVISGLDEKYYKRRFRGGRRIPALQTILASDPGTLASR